YDDGHLAWSAWQIFATEIGDDCEFYGGVDIMDPDMSYEVQRLWSNKSFLAGHTGCVPRPSSVYFNVTPLNLTPTNVVVTFPGQGGQNVKARTVNIPKGTTGILEVGFYSDGPRGDWTLSAVEGNNQPGSAQQLGLPGGGAAFADGNLTFSIDHPTGQNGNKAAISITVNGVDSILGSNLVTLISTDASTNVRHIFPVIISSN
ncbi:MAG: hypothetical protein ACHREM_30945, partial [Polyangiales bacterium]